MTYWRQYAKQLGVADAAIVKAYALYRLGVKPPVILQWLGARDKFRFYDALASLDADLNRYLERAPLTLGSLGSDPDLTSRARALRKRLVRRTIKRQRRTYET